MSISILISLLLIIFISCIFVVQIEKRRNAKTLEKYQYSKKDTIITQRELKFYKRLHGLLKKRCFIFPQMHLSCFLEHKIKGQNWKGALSHINGKSIDYLLLRKRYIKTNLCY